MGKRKRDRSLTKVGIPESWLARRAVDGGWLGDLAASILLVRYATVAFHLARGLGRQDADALDAVQEASFKAFNALKKGKYDPSTGRFGGWFLKIVKHECLALIRKGKRHASPSEGGDSNGPDTWELVEDPLPTPDEIAEAEELTDTLNQALQTLTHAERFVVEMRHHYGWTLELCAGYLEVSVAKVFKHYHCGMDSVRRFVERAELRAASPPEVRDLLDARRRQLRRQVQLLRYWQAPLGNTGRLGDAIFLLQQVARAVGLVRPKTLPTGRLTSFPEPVLYQHVVECQWSMIECSRQQLACVEREPTNIEYHLQLKDLADAMEQLMSDLDPLDFRDEPRRDIWRVLAIADS